jgi:cytidine deaminase
MQKPKQNKSMSKDVRAAYAGAKKIRQRAYAPYSKFKVGAALVTKRGKVYLGCNVENASYGGAVCAERIAIFKAISEGERDFSDVVVVTEDAHPAFPCAFCLQIMAEFFPPDVRIWIGGPKAIHEVRAFSELLPEPFGPKQLAEGLIKNGSRK